MAGGLANGVGERQCHLGVSQLANARRMATDSSDCTVPLSRVLQDVSPLVAGFSLDLVVDEVSELTAVRNSKLPHIVGVDGNSVLTLPVYP